MEKVRYLMTKKELVKVYVIKSLIDDKMTSRAAAEVLNLSERQIKRLKAGVKKDGEVFLLSTKIEAVNQSILSLVR